VRVYYKTSPQTTDPSTLYISRNELWGGYAVFLLTNRHCCIVTYCLFFADHKKYSCWCIGYGICKKTLPRFFCYTFHSRPRVFYDIQLLLSIIPGILYVCVNLVVCVYYFNIIQAWRIVRPSTIILRSSGSPSSNRRQLGGSSRMTILYYVRENGYCDSRDERPIIIIQWKAGRRWVRACACGSARGGI